MSRRECEACCHVVEDEELSLRIRDRRVILQRLVVSIREQRARKMNEKSMVWFMNVTVSMHVHVWMLCGAAKGTNGIKTSERK